MFSGVVGSIWGAGKREKQSANPIRIPTRFCFDFGTILGVILGAQIVQQSMWFVSVFGMPFGGLWEDRGIRVDTIRGVGGPGEG